MSRRPPPPRPPARATHVSALAHHLHALGRGRQPHQQVLHEVGGVVGGLEELVVQQLWVGVCVGGERWGRGTGGGGAKGRD